MVIYRSKPYRGFHADFSNVPDWATFSTELLERCARTRPTTYFIASTYVHFTRAPRTSGNFPRRDVFSSVANQAGTQITICR